jgi:hypothetical protein
MFLPYGGRKAGKLGRRVSDRPWRSHGRLLTTSVMLNEMTMETVKMMMMMMMMRRKGRLFL